MRDDQIERALSAAERALELGDTLVVSTHLARDRAAAAEKELDEAKRHLRNLLETRAFIGWQPAAPTYDQFERWYEDAELFLAGGEQKEAQEA